MKIRHHARCGAHWRAWCRLVLCLGAVESACFAAGDPPQLRGVMFAGDHWMASLTLAQPRVQRWCGIGDSIGSFRVESLSRDTVTIIDSAGLRHSMTLPAARVLDLSAPPTDAVAWRRWINSCDNPMMLRPADPPVPFDRWGAMTEGRRAEITDWYRLHGWKLVVRFDAEGKPAAEFSPLYQEERRVIVAGKERAFLGSLIASQRALYNQSMHDRSDDSAARFKASLDPVRRDAFESLEDFTKPLPAELR